MAKRIDLGHYVAKAIIDRAAQLRQAAGNRNERMDDYEAMYTLQMWRDPVRPGEVRVTLPVAFDMVEKFRALLITRPPVVSVPTNSAKPEDQQRAQKLEKFLYGVIDRTNLLRQFSDGEWHADCLGRGCLKTFWDASAADDDFPIVIMAVEPRTIYGVESPRHDRYMELTQQWERARREIEGEHPDFEFPRPTDVSTDMAREAAWLDEKVRYIEYWREIVVTERQMPEPKPVIEPTVVERASEMMVAAMSGIDQAEVDQRAADIQREAQDEEEAEPVKRRVRKIIHAIVVDDTGEDGTPGLVVKPAATVPYPRIPYAAWSGISTPMAGKNADLSVLFALSNGDAGDDAYGVLAAMCVLASADLESALTEPHAPIVTDDPSAVIDMSPDAKNYVKAGSTVQRIPPASTNPAVLRGLDLMTQQSQRVGIPGVWDGQPQSLSGQAISGFATAYQMVIGMRQQDRERALRETLETVLYLVRELADPDDGLRAYGNTAYGRYVEETVKPEDIGSDYRVTVKLSALQPKDDVGFMSLLSSLERGGQISLETMLDQVQKMIGLAGESPEDEMERILRNQILKSGDLAQQLATVLAQEYIDAFTARTGVQMAPEQPPQGMPEGGPAGPGGMPVGTPANPGMPSPMEGLPPGAMPVTPDMVGATGNLAGMMNMQAGQQVMPSLPAGLPAGLPVPGLPAPGLLGV